MGTPIDDLLLFHNEQKSAPSGYDIPQVLISLCMDQRISLNLPKGFAYILRTPGAHIHGLEFAVSYAIAMGGVRAMAVIGHTDCAMTRLGDFKEKFVRQLDEWHCGWNAKDALRHFNQWAPRFAVKDMTQHIRVEVERILKVFPGLLVAPLIYNVKDHRLTLLEDDEPPR